MYAYVKGKLTHLYPTHVVVETAGVTVMKFKHQILIVFKSI